MGDTGVFINGYIVSYDVREGEYDGKKKTTYRYMLISGMESFVISSEIDYRDSFEIKDLVTFMVNPRCYGGKIFFSGGRLVK